MSNIQINAADQIVDVSCSTAVADLQQALNEHSLMLGVLHDPDSELSVGELFMNGGHNLWRGAFGYLRDQVLAGSWALNDGDQISTGARVVKSVAGYDLTRLLLGSHDHLASCESLCLRLHPAFKRRHFYSIELAQYLQYSHFDLNPCSAFQAADGNIIISSHFELKREYLTAIDDEHGVKLELNLLRQFARANGKTALSARPATAPHPDFDWNSWQYPSDENQINSAHLQTIKLAFSSRSNDE